MGDRVGLGPVFAYEWLIGSRHWRTYAVRSLFVAGLLIGMFTVYYNGRTNQAISLRTQAEFGVSFFYAIVGIQLALVMLAAPAATAGAVCLDKARGTLLHVMVTDLADAEIVLGKLAARLLPTLMLVACVLPVMAIGTLLGGIDPVALLGAFFITLGVALLGCTLAFTLSIWGTKTQEVLLGTYAFWVLWLLAYPVAGQFGGAFTWATDWLPAAISGPLNNAMTWVADALRWVADRDPFRLAFAPYIRPGSVTLGDDLMFLAGCVAASVVLVVIGIFRIRPVTVRQANRVARRPGPLPRLTAWLPGPPLDLNPVFWREWHRNRPSRTARLIWTLYIVLATAFSVSSMLGGNMLAAWVNGLQVSIGLLLLSLSAATSLAEERVRGSLDVLMATPLPTHTILFGKWWGVFRVVPMLVVLPVLAVSPMVVNSWLASPGAWPRMTFATGATLIMAALIVAQGAAITSLGLALATWFSRISRAITLTVSVHVFMTVGWLFLCLVLGRPGLDSEFVAMGSPFMGAGNMSFWMGQPSGSGLRGESLLGWGVSWAVAYAIAAAALLGATLLTFNRCLGRMDGTSRLGPRWLVPAEEAFLEDLDGRSRTAGESAQESPRRDELLTGVET